MQHGRFMQRARREKAPPLSYSLSRLPDAADVWGTGAPAPPLSGREKALHLFSGAIYRGQVLACEGLDSALYGLEAA